MKYLTCAIADTTNSKFMAPWYAQNEEDAKRSFKHIMSGNDLMKTNASDFDCYIVAEWDDDKGVVNNNLLKINPDGSYEPKRIFRGGEVMHEV